MLKLKNELTIEEYLAWNAIEFKKFLNKLSIFNQ